MSDQRRDPGSAPDQRLREALTSVQFAHRHLLGDIDVTNEDASHSLGEAERSIRAALSEATTSPEATLDVERLATAICASREPPTTATADLFVDDDCRRLARLVVAQYEAMAEDAARLRGPA